MSSKKVYTRYLYLFMLISILLNIFIVDVAEASFQSTYNYEDWKKVRIDSKPAVPLTADEIRGMFETVNHPSSVYLKPGVAEGLIKASEKYGINPYIMINMSLVESTWGTSDLAKQANNLGGIKCTNRVKRCWGAYSHYETLDDYFEDKAWLIRTNYVNIGKNTLKTMLEKYAPSNDGNNHPDYIRNMAQNTYNRLGQRVVTDVDSGATMTPGDYSSDRMTPEQAEIFQQGLTEATRVGMANIGNENALESPYIKYTLGKISEKTYNILSTLSYVIIAFSFAYMAVMVFTYALYVNGRVGHEKARKIVGNKAVEHYGERKGILYIIGRIALGVVVVFIFVSKLHIVVYAQFYSMIENIMMLI